MAEKEVTIKVSANTAQAKANLSELGEQMKQLGQGGAGGDTTAPAGGITEEQADLLNKMQAQLVAYKAKVDELRAAYDSLAKSTSGASSKSSESLKALEGEVEVLKKQQSALVDKVLELQVENNRLRDTHAGAGSGAQSQASAENGLAQKMAYAAMNVRQLRKEIVSLNSARKAAAAAGDTKAYEELTAKVGAARTALRAATQARNVEKAAMMGQAAAGMQLANQLNALAESAASGQVNVASMANQVISLGMAFKAGLGPIGWTMAALQGLQLVMETVTGWEEKEAAAIAETEKLLKKKAEAMEALRLEEMKTANAIAKGQAEESARQAEAQGQAEIARLKGENAAKQAERERDLQSLRSTLKAETDLKKAAVMRGDISEEEFNAWQEGEKRKIEQAEKNNQLISNQEKEAVVKKELEISQAVLAARGSLYATISEKLDKDQTEIIAADDGELKALFSQYESLYKSQEDKRAVVEELRKKVEDATHWYWNDSGREELVEQLRIAEEELRTYIGKTASTAEAIELAYGDQLEILRKTGVATEDGMMANAKILLTLKEELNSADEQFTTQLAKHRELQTQLVLLQEGKKAIEQSVTEQQREADAAATLRKAKEDKARAEEESKKQEAEAKKQEAEAKKQEAEYNREIASELSRISGQYKVTGSYKEEDNRSAKQIRDCDRTILEAKERELRDLLARTSDEATREKIQAALDDTEKAQRALADATRKAADQEAKRLKNMAPPEFHSKNKQVDRNLQSLGKSYARYAKAAEKAAEAGDAKEMERAQKRMQYYAGRMGRASKDQEKADRMYRKDAEALEAVAEEHGKDYQRVKKAGQDKRREEAAEARRNRRANQDAARQQRTQQQAAQPQQQPQPQVNAQEVAARSQAAMQELAAQVSALTGACNGVAAAAEGAAKAAKAAVKTLNQKIKTLNEEVSSIREEVSE